MAYVRQCYHHYNDPMNSLNFGIGLLTSGIAIRLHFFFTRESGQNFIILGWKKGGLLSCQQESFLVIYSPEKNDKNCQATSDAWERKK